MTTAAQTKLHTEIRSIGTCTACAATYLFVGSTYDRNGQVCVCGTGLSHFTQVKGQLKSRVRWSKISAKTTRTECDGACRSAKSDTCACSCGGDNHGIAWAL